MAKRPIFIPTSPDSSELFTEEIVDFQWVPGLALSQGQKSAMNLHNAAKDALGINKILEISTRSNVTLGLQLSAFNLEKSVGNNKFSVETIYQSTKVFENGGPFTDLLTGKSIDAKTDLRLKNSGKLLHHEYQGEIWPLTSSPNIYDVIYISALLEFNRRKEILEFQAFSDIAYNQNSLKHKSRKSFNCQARSVAIYFSLVNRIPENEILDNLCTNARIDIARHEQIDLFE